jgi:hypothetical protein
MEIRKPTPYQQQILNLPQPVESPLVICQLSARSGGKSVATWWCLLRFLKQYGEDARVLVVRKTLSAQVQYINDLYAFLDARIEGLAVNRNANTISMNGIIIIQFGQLTTESILAYSGRSHNALIVEEQTEIEPELISQVAVTLRRRVTDQDGEILPMLYHRLGNPNPGSHIHTWTYHNFIDGQESGRPFLHGGLPHVWIESTWKDNPHLGDNYGQVLEGLKSAPDGDALYKAMAEGDWTAGFSDTFFGCVFSSENIVSQQHLDGTPVLVPDDMERWLIGADWGTSSPAYYLLVGVLGWDKILPSGLVLPAGTICCWAEYHTGVDGSKTKGDGRSPGDIMPHLGAMVERHRGGEINGALDCAAGANVAGHGEQTVLDFHNLASQVVRPRIRWYKAPKGNLQTRMSTLREKIQLRQIVFLEGKVPYLQETLVAQPRAAEPNLMLVSGPGSVRHGIDGLAYAISWLTRAAIQTGSWR